MKKNPKSFYLSLLMFPISGFCQEHLEPVEGIFNYYDYQKDYYSDVREILFQGLSDMPTIRYLVMPSFSPEIVIDISWDLKNKKFCIQLQRCDKSIWYSKNRKKLKVLKFKKDINENSVKLLDSLFKIAIKQTRYSEEKIIGTDGTDYYFMVDDFGNKSGKIWSPYDGKMKKLVNIGDSLVEFAQNKENDLNIETIKNIQNLIQELSNGS